MRKTSFEWVVVMNDGTEHYLTENQYAVYKDSWRDGPMFFRDFMINPSFVVHAYKQPARELYKIYPCLKCNTNGTLPVEAGQDPFSAPECPDCKGTGLDFNYVPQNK